MDDSAFISFLRLYLSVFPVAASGVPDTVRLVAGLYLSINDLYSPVSDFNSLIFVSNREYSELLILYTLYTLNTLYCTDTYNIEYIPAGDTKTFRRDAMSRYRPYRYHYA